MQPCGKCISRASRIRTRLADENHACANKGASHSPCRYNVAAETKREDQEPRACTFCCTKMPPPFTLLRSFPCLRFDRFVARKSSPTCFVFATVSRSIYASLRSINSGYVVLRFCLNIPYSRPVAEPPMIISQSKPKTSYCNITGYSLQKYIMEILKVNFH